MQRCCCKERLPQPRTLALASRVLNERNIEVYRKRSLVHMSKIRRGAIFAVIMLEPTQTKLHLPAVMPLEYECYHDVTKLSVRLLLMLE